MDVNHLRLDHLRLNHLLLHHFIIYIILLILSDINPLRFLGVGGGEEGWCGGSRRGVGSLARTRRVWTEGGWVVVRDLCVDDGVAVLDDLAWIAGFGCCSTVL